MKREKIISIYIYIIIKIFNARKIIIIMKIIMNIIIIRKYLKLYQKKNIIMKIKLQINVKKTIFLIIHLKIMILQIYKELN